MFAGSIVQLLEDTETSHHQDLVVNSVKRPLVKVCTDSHPFIPGQTARHGCGEMLAESATC